MSEPREQTKGIDTLAVKLMIVGLFGNMLAYTAAGMSVVLLAGVVMFGMHMSSSDWMFYAAIKPDGTQTLWYKNPDDYVAMVKNGDVIGTMPDVIYVDRAGPQE